VNPGETTLADGKRPLVYTGSIVTESLTTGTIIGRAIIRSNALQVVPAAPAQGPTLLQNIIKSYLYVQYNDDADLQAMRDAYNAYTQSYLDYLNALNLPIYTDDPVFGPLLDWVGTNLYGYPRPSIPMPGKGPVGGYNTYTYNGNVINGNIPGVASTVYITTDDVYRRCLTWHFWKGDGHQGSIPWLKRRVARFLLDINGKSPFDTIVHQMAEDYGVSIHFTSSSAATISVPTSPIATIFANAVQANILELPFQITWTVTQH
jgi:hypothetical protein